MGFQYDSEIGVTVASDKNFTFVSTSNVFYVNSGTFTNNGIVTTSNPSGTITINVNSSGGVNNPAVIGNGTFSATEAARPFWYQSDVSKRASVARWHVDVHRSAAYCYGKAVPAN